MYLSVQYAAAFLE